MTGEAEKEILRILEEALNKEAAAEKLYSRGAQLASRPEVKEIFLNLADEEKQHGQTIRDLYYQYKKRLGLKILHTDEPD